MSGHTFERLDLGKLDWYSVLPSFGISPDFLVNKHGPCPLGCQGETNKRFRFDNKGNRGTFICNSCGAGDGVRLISLFKGWSDAETFKQMKGDSVVLESKKKPFLAPVEKPKDVVKLKAKLQALWDACLPIKGTPAELYLQRRVPGLDISTISTSMRFHPALEYWEQVSKGKWEVTGRHPALVARVVGMDGIPFTLHRTFLTKDGYKAQVEEVKKQMESYRKLSGEAIRLNVAKGNSRVLLVAEGIETGFAVATSTDNKHEVWSGMNYSNLAKLQIPDRFEKVIICADRDKIGKQGFRPGEHGAELLAERIRASGKNALIRVPKDEGVDFCDLWFEKMQTKIRAVG
jgi:putative DNA primase/helicase